MPRLWSWWRPVYLTSIHSLVQGADGYSCVRWNVNWSLPSLRTWTLKCLMRWSRPLSTMTCFKTDRMWKKWRKVVGKKSQVRLAKFLYLKRYNQNGKLLIEQFLVWTEKNGCQKMCLKCNKILQSSTLAWIFSYLWKKVIQSWVITPEILCVNEYINF